MEPTGLWTRVALSATVLLAGCHARPPEQMASAEAPCLPPGEGPLPASIRAADWAGPYHLTMVATSGEKADRSVTGTLTLVAPEERYRRPPASTGDTATRLPLIGTTSMDLGAIGAVEVGSLESADPARPGVLVLTRTRADGGLDATIRFGADANDWSKTRFDGGYTALFVRQVDANGFAGVWRSGVNTVESGGHFCARRAGG